MKRNLLLPAIGVAAAITLAGCAGNENPAASDSAPSSSQQPASSATGSPMSAEHNDADTMFAQMMTPNHKQAVQMSEIMLTKDGIDSEITAMDLVVKDGDTQIWIASATGVRVSRDMGRTFTDAEPQKGQE